MRHIIFLSALYFIPFFSNGQVRSITGKVVYESDFVVMPEVKIQNSDTTLLGTTDKNGNFKIEVPSETVDLLLSYIGMEWTSIKVPANCNKLEIMMMVDVVYDYIPINKINKKRFSCFKKLPEKHRQAYKKGIFTSDAPCLTYIFHKY